jgi:hypothetical protein
MSDRICNDRLRPAIDIDVHPSDILSENTEREHLRPSEQ